MSSSPLRVLTIAPMGSYPPMMGDSKRIHRIASALAELGAEGVCLGKNYILRGMQDVTLLNGPIHTEKQRKRVGIEALLRQGHYNEVKHCGNDWVAFAAPYLADPRFNVLYCQFLYTYPMVRHAARNRLLVIDTNNSEWQWYDRFAEATRSPAVKLICRNSKRRADQIMQMLPTGTVMAHVSQSDLEDYQRRRPDLIHLCVPNGCEIVPRHCVPDYAQPGKKTLVFFGSLAGKMSLDALTYFANAFWPTLRDVADLVVAGAHPASAVVNLCSVNGWQLRSDLSEEEVTELFHGTHYSILPFTYGVGSKLKLLDACSRGVPVLTTQAGACGQTDLPSFVQVLESADDWKRAIQTRKAMENDWWDEVMKFGARFTWKTISTPLYELLSRDLESLEEGQQGRRPLNRRLTV